MISWIQKYFQKHFRIVFGIILVAVALPMVIVYSQSSSGLGRAGTKVLERPFFNLNLENAADVRRVFDDGRMSAQLRYGFQNFQATQIQQYSLQRIAGLALADELHLPTPTADQVAKHVLSLRAFQDKQGQFDNSLYTQFGDMVRTSGAGGATTADVNRVLRDDTRLEALSKVVGGPGYVLPADVKDLLARADATWTVQLATVDYASFNPAIATPDDVLQKFYTDNSFRYEVPARPRLSYVEFKNADFIPPTNPTEAELRAYYDANTSQFPAPFDATETKPTTPAVPGVNPIVDNFPKVRAQVEAALRNAVGARGAAKAANDLSTALYERKLTANSPALDNYLAGLHLPAKALAPFPPDQPPADKPWLAKYAEEISRLSQERFYTDPLATPDSSVVLLWNESLPAYKPMFAEVRDRVIADYKEGERRKLFIAHGQALHAQLQAAAKSPEEFARVAAAEKLTVKSFTGFTLRQPPPDLPYEVESSLQGLATGQVSDMVVSAAEKGYLVYAQEKKVPDLTPANPRYDAVQKELMAQNASANQNSYLGALVERELKRTETAKVP